MHPLLLFHLSTLAVLVWWVRYSLVLLFAPSWVAPAFGFKPTDLAWSQAHHFRRVQAAFLWYCLLAAYAHAYHAEHVRLRAKLDVALAQPPPYGCADNWDRSTLSLWERARGALFVDFEARCAEWEAARHISAIPNPLVVLFETVLGPFLRFFDDTADALGAALSRFLGHFSWLIQLTLISAGTAALLVCVWLRPWSPAARTLLLHNEGGTTRWFLHGEENCLLRLPPSAVPTVYSLPLLADAPESRLDRGVTSHPRLCEET